MGRVADLLGADAIAAVRRPLQEARALPPAAYTAADFFALERERVFRRHWISIAFADEVAEPGDAIPLDAAGVPVILLRDREGAIRAFHNVCRHRGSAILSAPVKGQPTLRCPYHGWAYALDGRLRATPLWDGRRVTAPGLLDREALGLVPIRCGVWADIVFLDLSGSAPPLEEYVRPVAARWAPYETESLRLGHRAEGEIAANWKLAIEGAIENYHEDFVHPSLPARIDGEGRKTFTDIAEGAMFGFCWSGESALRSETPLIPLRPEAASAERTDYLCFLFPNTQVNLYGSVSVRVIWTPIAPDRTRLRSSFYVVAQAAEGEEFAAGRAAMAEYWCRLREEDRQVIEAMQQGRRSPAAGDFRFSPFWEASVHHFQNTLLAAMLASEAGSA
ncbi:MAG: aromatic ring-hydroxylating dioxygenase subunit alpha [Alphaproteobacteria bacterium]|nr:aromatic ring-hydroxylating dioxygenase subunit alpha [Alphaproteobacteria bacterium]